MGSSTEHRGRKARVRNTALDVVAVLVVLAVVTIWLFPDDLTRSDATYARIAWLVFMARSLGVQLAIPVTLLGLLVLARRRWIAAAALVAVTVFLASPVFDVTKLRQAPSGDTTRIMSANLLYENTDADRVLDEVDRVDPDVLLLQEYTLRWHRDIDTELRTRYRYAADRTVLGSNGVAIYSRLPIVGTPRLLDLGDSHRLQTRAVIRVDDRDLAVYDIHLTVPLQLVGHAEQRMQVPRLARLLEAERLPMVVAGDMNFTETSRHHGTIVDTGLRSAWEEVGRGRGSTWNKPGWPTWLPGLRLDHMFVSPSVDVDNMEIAARTGSDHRPIYADIRIDD